MVTYLKKTTREQRAELAQCGFVHVTGLEAQNLDKSWHTIGDELSIRQLGKYCQNNGVAAITTDGGEVWIGSSMGSWPECLQEIAPNEEGCFVPCSNGEEIRQRDLLRRLANPNWEPNGIAVG